MYSRLILKDRPEIIWPLDDINQSSSFSMPVNFYPVAASVYAASINPLLTDVISSPMIYGGRSAIKLSNSSSANVSIPLLGRFSELYANKESSIEFWMKCDSVPASEIKILTKRNNPNIGLYLRENYLIFRYGTSSSYMQAVYGLGELSDPTHIVMNHNNAGIELIVNGISTITDNENAISLPIDPSQSANDYFDFYGSPSVSIFVDCIAMYSFNLRSNTAKKHYVFGLGRDIDENVFFSLGGDFYNFSTESTQKSFYAEWDSPGDWTLTQYDNLIETDFGIRPYLYDLPEFVSFDNKINTSNNLISFTSSAGVTSGTYIEIDNLPNILGNGDRPFFTEVQFSGQTPTQGFPQTIMSYGVKPFNPLISFNLTNISGSFYLIVLNNVNNASVSFPITNISSNPTAVIGMSNSNNATFYYGQSGSALQTASFVNFSGSSYGVDSISNFFPPGEDNIIRIGSALTYDSTSDISITGDVGQFTGTFLSFSVLKENFSGSTFASVDGYASPVYSLIYDSSKSGFRNRSYGNANIILHGNTLAGPIDSGSAVLSANRFEFGYPDVLSGSQVNIYATLYNYSGSVVSSKVKLQKNNSLGWLNYIDLNDKYLSIDIDVLSEDSFDYPPFIRYFKAETYEYSGSYVEILDNSGDRIRINSSSTASGNLYIPEFELTPTIFLNNSSGVRIFKNTADIEFSPISNTMDLNDIGNLLLWYDAISPKGPYQDPYLEGASANALWASLSGSAITASVVTASNQPQYRTQSLNIMQINEMNGSESGSVTGFSAVSSTIQSSIDIASSGNRSIKVIPSGTSGTSYMSYLIDHTTNIGRRFLFPGQQYTVVGDLSLVKIQEYPNQFDPRRIIIVAASTSPQGTLSTIFGPIVPNSIGTHSTSVTFTVPNGTNILNIRFYNGSSVSGDPVYWDNMGIYSGSVISGSPAVFYQPLETFDDRPTYKFNGLNQYFTSSVSIAQPMTIYIVGRAFGNDSTFVGHTASAPAIYTSSGTFRMGAGVELSGASINTDFNVICGVFNSNSSSLFVNNSVVSGNVGTGSYSSAMTIGYRLTPSGSSSFLSGDISAVLVFKAAHNKSTVDIVMNSLKDSFNIDY